MRAVLCVLYVLFAAGFCRAEEPKKYYLVDGQVIEQRVSDLEKRVAELEKKAGPVAKAPCVCGDNCACKPGECPAKCPTAAAKSGCACAPAPGGVGTCGSYLCPANGGGGGCPCGRTPAKAVHVSPDGTVNELHADGVYRPIPGEPKRTPTAVPTFAAPRFFAPCPGGQCPTR